ncbi:LysR family transcriptional regulator [Eupransor demetentiae]|uniref:LysR family (LysR) n=1 Tax=Eupransor demetentiae TaxID=3109584 RepID=A0ABM9N499_9LACO|nr:DNA-binding transcriptional regulator [Lactobacillaceae bacterium LMG 33000]
MKTFAYEIFTTVASQKSFRKAANELNITPSAVSHAISQLEEQLGFPLFIRNRSEMTLTQDGKTILPSAERLLNEERQLYHLASNIRGLNAGKITIGAFSSVCINWLPEIITNFSKNYPQIEIAIVQGNFAELEHAVELGKIDIAFTTLPVSSRLEALPLLQDEILCVTRADFKPKNSKTITKADLLDQHFILQKSDYDLDTKAALDYYEVTPKGINFSIDDQSIIALVEAGLGLGILPQLALRKLRGDVNIYPFDRPYYRHVGLAINPSQLALPAVKAMKKEILDYLAKNEQ